MPDVTANCDPPTAREYEVAGDSPLDRQDRNIGPEAASEGVQTYDRRPFLRTGTTPPSTSFQLVFSE